LTLYFKYAVTVLNGALLPDAAAMQETIELVEIAERSGDDVTLASARFVRGVALLAHPGAAQRGDGFALLAATREAALQERFTMAGAWFVDTILAAEKARAGDLDGSIELARTVLEDEYASGGFLVRAPATAVLVELLLRRSAGTDLQEAPAAIDRLAAVPTEPGFVMHEIQLLRLRALLARAHGDNASCQDFRDRYRAMAKRRGFDGHIAMAEAMA
jgi:adenylate cyclase